MLKVAIVVHQFPQLSETFILNQITALIDVGVDVQVFSYYRPDPSQKIHPQFKYYKLIGITQYGEYLPADRASKYKSFIRLLLGASKGKYRRAIFNTLNFIKYGKIVLNLQYFYRALLFNNNYNFDIIHCHFGPVGHDIVQLRKMGVINGKIITSFHGFDFQRKDVLKFYNNYRKLFKTGDGFIANSSFTKGKLIALGCSSSKINIIPVSISNKLLDLTSSIKFNHKPKNFNVLTIARLEEVKGIEYALHAMNILKKLSFNFIYKIIGSGSLEKELKMLVQDLQLTDKVQFLGSKSQDEIKDALLIADVLLLTSVTTVAGASEAQGLVLLEAQTVGKPVIASRSGGIPDSLIEGETGLLVPEKDVEEIASALIWFYDNPELRFKMGKRGQDFVNENFNPKTINESILSYYQNILLTQ